MGIVCSVWRAGKQRMEAKDMNVRSDARKGDKSSTDKIKGWGEEISKLLEKRR